MASSYLLDQSKRITSPQIPELKYGEIAPECLKNIGFTFKEDFTEAAKELEDSYDEIFKPVIEILNSLLKATGIKFPSDPKKLREQLIVIDSMLTLLQAKINAETSTTDGTSSTDGTKDETSAVIQELSSMLQNWSYAYTHVIPMRKSSPRIDMKIGGELKIDFAYGKCNLFNARKEVWEPLMKIKSKLFPTTTPFSYDGKTTVDGLSTIQGIDVPFLNAAFPATFFTLLSKTTENKFPFQKELSLQSEEGVLGRSLSGAVDSLKKSAKEAIGELREGVSEVFTGNSEEGTNGSGSTGTQSGGTQAQPAESQINKKLKEQMNGITSVKDNLARIIMNKPAITAYINEQFYEKNLAKNSFMFRLGYPQMFAYRVEDLCKVNSNRISLNEVIPTSVDVTFDFSNTDEAGTPMSGQLTIKGLWSLRTSGGSLNLWEA
jgi:hypothetical protein